MNFPISVESIICHKVCFSMYRSLIICLFIFTGNYLLAQDTLFVNSNKLLDLFHQASAYSVHENILYGRKRGQSKPGMNPLEINYSYGQLYSPETAWKVEVNQSFGNVFQNKRKADLVQKSNNIDKAQFQLNTRQAEIQILSIYLEWIYLYNLLDNINLLREYLSKCVHVSGMKKELGVTEPLEDLKVRVYISELETAYTECMIDIDIKRNQLSRQVGINTYLLPINRKLELYQVRKESDTSRYTGNYISDIFLEKYHQSQTQINVDKAGLAPSIHAGFFVQEIGNQSSLAGVKAGISLPIWYLSNKEKIRKSEIQSAIDYSNYQQSIESSQIEIENILLRLDKHFLKIRHYQNYALQAANLQIKTAVAKYAHEEIEYEEYFELITEALLTKRKYLELINAYNQEAVKLELYSK